MDLASLVGRPGEWLAGTGPESDIVISTRLRLARNIHGFPFLTKASTDHRTAIQDHVVSAVKGTPLGASLAFFDLKEALPLDRLLLVERHLISKEHANSEGDRSVAFEPLEIRSIMVNEEDHLRIQVLRSGLQLDSAWAEINEIDDVLSGAIEFAFSPQYGFLTACPTNVGTGLRVSVMLHLPALVMTRQIEKVFAAVSKIQLAVRGLFGEGTQASGDFYQISNQVTLGVTETEILDRLRKVVPKILEYERNIRDTLKSESKPALEDKVKKALEKLKKARSIPSEEALNLLSALRLGINMRVVGDLTIQTVNEIFLQSQPAHLQKIEGRSLSQEERDSARAAFIRKRLN